MNIENRLKKLENSNKNSEYCCESPYQKIIPKQSNEDKEKCGNCGNKLRMGRIGEKVEVVVTYPKLS